MRPVPRRWNRFFHVPKGTPYHVENSIRGLERAEAEGWPATDLDGQLTKDLVPVITHWSRPLLLDGFRDPLGKIGRTRRISSMTAAEVRRLITRDGYRIHTAHTMFRHAAERGLAVEFESKDDRFALEGVMASLRADALAAGANVRVKALSNVGKRPDAVLRAARAAGFRTILLVRGRIPRSFAGCADYYRGRLKWKR